MNVMRVMTENEVMNETIVIKKQSVVKTNISILQFVDAWLGVEPAAFVLMRSSRVQDLIRTNAGSIARASQQTHNGVILCRLDGMCLLG